MSTQNSVTLSAEEARVVFVQHVAGVVEYWENEKGSLSNRERLEGVAFSILTALDGSGLTMPPFTVRPIPDEKGGFDFFGTVWPDKDLGGGLHDIFDRELKKKPEERTELQGVLKRLRVEMDNFRETQ